MLAKNKKHIILTVLFACCNTVLFSQISRQDSISIEKLLKSDKPLILNQEVVKSIMFDGVLIEQTPEQLIKKPSYLIPHVSVSEFVMEKDGQLTLCPYTIYLKPYEDPIHGLSPPILMHTEIESNNDTSATIGSPGANIIAIFDAESILRRIFWKSERAKRKNAKRVQAHKYY